MLRTLRWMFLALLLVVPGGPSPAETVATLPAPTGYVNDLAGVLSPDTRQNLDSLCTQVDQKAHAQIAVVTVKTIDPDKSGATPSIEEFATALEDKWKVGQKGTDRGVLLIVVLNPRKYRIEVGYGLEGLLNDAKVGDIGRDMRPMLHDGDYNQGISVGVRELAQDIATDAGVTLTASGYGTPERAAYEQQPQGIQISPVKLFIFGGIIVVVLGILIATGHIGLLFYLLFNLLGGGRGGGYRGGGFGGGGFGDGGGDGGGGFGGFGGGSSGGGGASGDY